MKKLTIIILVIAVVGATVLCLASCDKNGDDGTLEETVSATTESNNAPSSAATPLILAKDGKAQVSIVYQSRSSSFITQSIDTLKLKFESNYGIYISAIPDSIHEKDETKTEILLGETKYDSSIDALNDLSEYSYSVSVKDNKIIISANHAYLFPFAVDALLEGLCYENNTLSIDKSFSFESQSYEAAVLSRSTETDHMIVYEYGNEVAREYAEKIQLSLSNYGVHMEVIDDKQPGAEREIIIGNTNRELSKESKAYYKNAWLGVDEKENVAITGNIPVGAEQLLEYIKAIGSSSQDIILIEPMFGTFIPEGYGNAPEYKGAGEVELTENYEHTKSYFLTIHGASRGDYEDYTDLLAESGFTRHRSSKANGNLFETWTDGYSILTMSHIVYNDPDTQDKYAGSKGIGYVSYITVAVESTDHTSLPVCEPNTEKLTTVQLTTINKSGTMGYILRLEDGRFIIIDGGFKNPHTADIYNTIKEQNVLEGKPIIAAWLITHPHTDHIEAPLTFLRTYTKDEVEIQAFIHHLPSEDLVTKKGVSKDEISGYISRWYAPIYENLSTKFPDTKVILAHAGQHFEYGSIKIDVLFTSENIYKKSMADTNTSSVMYSIKGNSGRMIILGDQQEIGCALLNAIYGDTLKCDLVQVAHHGYNGGDTDMYASMAAKYAIWPSSYEDIIERKAHYNPSYGRNFFDFRTVEYNIIPYLNGDAIVLYEGMTKAELAKLDVGLTIPK